MAVSSVVERLPYKQVVIGSNPIPPNNNRYRLICPLGPSSKGLGQGPSKSLMQVRILLGLLIKSDLFKNFLKYGTYFITGVNRF